MPAHAPVDGGQWKRPLMDWVQFQDNLTPDSLFERWYGAAGEHRLRKNMGLIAGRASGGLVVVDLDSKPGSQAADWWRALILTHWNGIEPETWAQRTGGGGRQVLFRAPDGWSPPTFKTPIGIDIRGQGGFAMLPPSLHSSGRQYEWEDGRAPWDVELEVAPPELVEAIDQLREEHGGLAGSRIEFTPSPEAKNAFGLDVDDREHKLQTAVWGAVVDLYRESPIRPPQDVQEREIARLLSNYLLTTKSRLQPQPGLSNADLLEMEGRGESELRRKWAYAMRRWDGKVREAAAEPRPNPVPVWNERKEAPDLRELGAPLGGVEPGVNIPPPDIQIIEKFEGEPPARQWLVDEWIAEGAVNSLYGGSGTGKSLLAMQLGAAMSTGTRWLGLPTKPGRVLGVFCEDEADELHRRLWSLKLGLGYALGWPFEEFKLAVRTGHENRLAVADPRFGLASGPFFLPLRALVERLNPALLILDTLADVYGANEIDRAQVNWFLKTILHGMIVGQRERGESLTVLLIGHPSASGKADGRGYSGSGAWEAGVRSRLYLTKPEDGSPDERVLTRGKANYAAAGDETAIRLAWDSGVFKASRGVDSGERRALERAIARLVSWACDTHAPYTIRRGHRRNAYTALVADLEKEGFEAGQSRQVIREMIEDEMISVGRKRGMTGLHMAE